MANKKLFQTTRGPSIRPTDIENEAKGAAYAFGPKHALAQLAATGCLNQAFYADAASQLDAIMGYAAKLDPEFIAKAAIWTRGNAYMKDVPALLLAMLCARDGDLFEKAFDRVIDNGKMLRNFVQIVRSGVCGRKSFGSRPRRLIREWLEARDDAALFRASVGGTPSMADIVRMVHPRPRTPTREAIYAWMIGKPHRVDDLPELVREFEAFKADRTRPVPEVPFQMLTALELGREAWTAIARNAPWQMTRMNLNTFARHGVFSDAGVTAMIRDRLRDPALIAKARVFPYQLMAAYSKADAAVPREVTEALQDAMEIAIGNVPAFDGKAYVLPDVSGSMQSSVTGVRKGSTSAVRCIDVAGLMAAAVLRRNPEAEVIPFEGRVVEVRLNPRDSVMTNAAALAKIGGGSTNCSAPLHLLNERKAPGDLVIFVSDNQSWVDSSGKGQGTEVMREWEIFRKRNPKARLVCIDIQPYAHTQAHEREDILNIGGFSDHVFEVISHFAKGELGADHWVGLIEAVEL